jgi:hypothetical protein
MEVNRYEAVSTDGLELSEDTVEVDISVDIVLDVDKYKGVVMVKLVMSAEIAADELWAKLVLATMMALVVIRGGSKDVLERRSEDVASIISDALEAVVEKDKSERDGTRDITEDADDTTGVLELSGVVKVTVDETRKVIDRTVILSEVANDVSLEDPVTLNALGVDEATSVVCMAEKTNDDRDDKICCVEEVAEKLLDVVEASDELTWL